MKYVKYFKGVKERMCEKKLVSIGSIFALFYLSFGFYNDILKGEWRIVVFSVSVCVIAFLFIALLTVIDKKNKKG